MTNDEAPDQVELPVGSPPHVGSAADDLAARLDALVWAMASDLDNEPEVENVEVLRRRWVSAYETSVIAMQEHQRIAALHGLPISPAVMSQIEVLLELQASARAAYYRMLRPGPSYSGSERRHPS